jgi:chromosome segregation ATPase
LQEKYTAVEAELERLQADKGEEGKTEEFEEKVKELERQLEEAKKTGGDVQEREQELQDANARVASAFEEAESAREALTRVQSEMEVWLPLLPIRSNLPSKAAALLINGCLPLRL